jgi:UDP-N-acetylglucosamine acyltransferase
MAEIHPTACVDPGATLGEGVKVGPFCVVDGQVTLGAGTVLHSHVVVTGRTRVGARTQIFPFASIGHQPQDLKFGGEASELIIGDDNVIREYATMNPGTRGGGMVTRVGDKCLFMMGAHVAHDCQIGDGVIMANNATFGGHVKVGNHAVIGGLSAVHQFVRIGPYAMVGGMSGVENDIIPYAMVMGNRARLSGLNIVGLRRNGFAREDIQMLKQVYDALFADQLTMAERLDKIETDFTSNGLVGDVLSFVRADSSRSLCQPKVLHGG